MGVAESLIEKAKSCPPPFSREHLIEISALVAHNRSSSHGERVSAADTIEALGLDMSPKTFNRRVKAYFGCTFGGNK
jgi:hypothetical protein